MRLRIEIPNNNNNNNQKKKKKLLLKIFGEIKLNFIFIIII